MRSQKRWIRQFLFGLVLSIIWVSTPDAQAGLKDLFKKIVKDSSKVQEAVQSPGQITPCDADFVVVETQSCEQAMQALCHEIKNSSFETEVANEVSKYLNSKDYTPPNQLSGSVLKYLENLEKKGNQASLPADKLRNFIKTVEGHNQETLDKIQKKLAADPTLQEDDLLAQAVDQGDYVLNLDSQPDDFTKFKVIALRFAGVVDEVLLSHQIAPLLRGETTISRGPRNDFLDLLYEQMKPNTKANKNVWMKGLYRKSFNNNLAISELYARAADGIGFKNQVEQFCAPDQYKSGFMMVEFYAEAVKNLANAASTATKKNPNLMIDTQKEFQLREKITDANKACEEKK